MATNSNPNPVEGGGVGGAPVGSGVPSPSADNKTGLYIAIGVGAVIVIVGLVMYLL